MALRYCDYLNGNDANPGTLASPKQTLQATVNIATRGDTIFIANTSAQVPIANISFSTGYNSAGTGFLSFVGWDNGGAISIDVPSLGQTPAFEIDGTNTTTMFNTFPHQVSFKFGKLHTLTQAFTGLFGSVYFGNEFYNNSVTGFGWSLAGEAIVVGNIFRNNTAQQTMRVAEDSIISNNVFANNTTLTGDSQAVVVSSRSTVSNNLFYGNNSTNIYSASGGKIFGNTIVGNAGANNKGVYLAGNNHTLYNNLFYNIIGGSTYAIKGPNSSILQSVKGFNAFYDVATQYNNFNATIEITSSDITGTGDPFVDSVNNDYTLTVASGARGVGLSNPNSFVDIGAVQAASGGGTTNNIFILND